MWIRNETLGAPHFLKKFEALERVKQAVLDKRLDTSTGGAEKGGESLVEEDEVRRAGETEESARGPAIRLVEVTEPILRHVYGIYKDLGIEL